MAGWKTFLVDSFPQLVLSFLVYAYNFHPRDYDYFKANPLKPWEVYMIYSVSMFFIFKNVLPKYITHGGARRHYNDVKRVDKQGWAKFFSKNYIRLGFHILSGAMQVIFGGAYSIAPVYFNSHFSFEFLQKWFLFWDTMHQTTGWLMTRNHDGIFAIRGYNLAFMVAKLFICGEISRMTELTKEFVSLIGGLFILTSGFAWVRFTCSIIAIVQCTFYKVDMTGLRENWYSIGLWLGQVAIAWRMHLVGQMSITIAFCAVYFPIELWIKSRAHHRTRNILISSFIAAFYFVPSPSLAHHLQLFFCFIYFFYTMFFTGLYWKRAPIPGVDYNEEDVKHDREARKNLNLRRSSSYRYIRDYVVAKFVSVSKPDPTTGQQISTHPMAAAEDNLDSPYPNTLGVPAAVSPLSCSLSDELISDGEIEENLGGSNGRKRFFRTRPSRQLLGTARNHQKDILALIRENQNLSPEDLATHIVRFLTKNKALKVPIVRHPMMEAFGSSYDENSRSRELQNSISRELQSQRSFVSRTPSNRGHYHY